MAAGSVVATTTFKDAVVDATRSKVKQDQTQPVGMIKHLHPHMSKRSGMRSLLMDVAVWYWRPAAFERAKRFKNAGEILADVAVAILHTDKIADCPIETKDTCAYHEHVADDKPCWRTVFLSRAARQVFREVHARPRGELKHEGVWSGIGSSQRGLGTSH